MTITRPATCDGSFPPRVLLFVEVVERHVQPALAVQRIVNKLLYRRHLRAAEHRLRELGTRDARARMVRASGGVYRTGATAL